MNHINFGYVESSTVDVMLGSYPSLQKQNLVNIEGITGNVKYVTMHVSIEESKHRYIKNAFVFFYADFFYWEIGPQHNALLIIA